MSSGGHKRGWVLMEREKEETLEMGPEFRHERTSRPRLGLKPSFKLRRTHASLQYSRSFSCERGLRKLKRGSMDRL